MSEQPTEEKKDTLLSLLSDLEDADNGLVEFDPEKHRDMLITTELKIDAYKYVMMKYESRIEEINAEIKELTEIKRSLERKSESMKKALLWVLQQKGIEKFPGVKYVISVISKAKIVLDTEPNPAYYLNYPELVRREYSWDKRAFDAAFKSNPELAGLAHEEKTSYIQFKLKKGID